MNRRTFSELRISPSLPVEATSDLCGARFESEQLYKLCLPSNSSSSRAMRLRGGELDGMLTTTLIGSKGIEGVAGLKPVSVSVNSISPLVTLRHLHAISACIASLADNLDRLHLARYEEFHAEVEGAISALADIAPRIDEAVLDDSYRTALLVDVRRIKGQLLACFEKELKEFERFVGKMCEDLGNARRNGNYSNACIGNISRLGRSEVFSTISFLSVCELFEVVLVGTFSERMMAASFRTLTAQRDKVLAVANKYYQDVIAHLEYMDSDNAWYNAGREWHLARMKEHSGNLDSAWKEFDLLGRPPALLDAFLNGDAGRVEEFWFFVRDDRINISTEHLIESSEVKLLVSEP